ncbi:MAG: hypothetical protein H0V66_05865 [Bdellovibrionales bacterium]|nr:hypothetical protein [Bdellovibrionales bacterium]
MEDNLAQILQFIGITLWLVHPNGTMILATWFSYHWPEVMLPEMEDEDFWIPQLKNKGATH